MRWYFSGFVKEHISPNCNGKMFSAFTGHVTYTESLDAACFVWTEDKTDMLCDVTLDWKEQSDASVYQDQGEMKGEWLQKAMCMTLR